VREEVKALVQIVAACIEAVEDSPQGIPEGHLFVLVQSAGLPVNAQQFEKLVGLMESTGKVKRNGRLVLAA
jgi:hypothetical protein